jgi:hypothetical protein
MLEASCAYAGDNDMHLQTGTPKGAFAPAQGLADRGLAQPIARAEVNSLVRSMLAPAPVPRSAPCLPLSGEPPEPAAEFDRWELLERCYREHMARRALEEMFAAEEMSAFGD